MNQYISVIDIGSKYIKGILFKHNESNTEILANALIPSRGVANGSVVNINSASSSIEQTVDTLERLSGIEIDTVYAGINSNEIKTSSVDANINVAGNQISEIHIKRLYHEASKKISKDFNKFTILHVISKFFVDTKPIDYPIEMFGNQLSSHSNFVFAPESLVKNITQTINKCGLELNGLFYNPFAELVSITDSNDKKIGTLVINIGASNTSVSVIFDGNLVFSDSIPMAGNNIDNDIAKVFGIPLEEAEKIKKHYSYATTENASSSKLTQHNITIYELAEVTEARLEVILYQIYKMLKNIYINNKSNKTGILDIISKILVSGGTANIQDIDRLTQKIFNKNTQVKTAAYHGNLQKIMNNTIFNTAFGLMNMVQEQNFSYHHKQQSMGIGHKLVHWYKELF